MNAFPLWFENVTFAKDPSRFTITGPDIFLRSSPDPPQNGTFNLSSPQFQFSATWNRSNSIVPSSYYGFELALPLFTEILGTNGTIVETSCTYPLSGQYDHLPRILFYVLLILAILFRRNSWVVSAALGVTMSYSASSAIHFFVLLSYHGFHSADVDYFGIFPVLATATVMLTPVFTWSSTFRTHRAKTVILYWAVLVYIALFMMMFLIAQFNTNLRRGGFQSKDIYGPRDFLNEIAAFTVCNTTAERCSYNALYSDLTYERFTACNCIDFCGLLSPPAPLRTGQNMVANVGRNSSDSLIYSEGGVVKPLFLRITTLTQVVLIFALAQGLVVLLQGTYTQQQVRDWIYRVLSMKARNAFNKRESVFLSPDQQHTSTYRKGRHWTAMIVAAVYYTLTMFTTVLYIPVFLLTIAVGEVLVADMPESEHSDSVGAWTPWVSASLIAVGALIMNYHSPLTHAIGQWIKFICCCCCGRRTSDDQTEKQPELAERSSVRTTAFDSFVAFFRHAGYEVRLWFWRIKHRFVEFGQWWWDPQHNATDEKSERQRTASVREEIEKLRARIESLERGIIHPPPPPGAPRCSCAKCAHTEYTAAPMGDTSYHNGYGRAIGKGNGGRFTTIEV